MRRTGLLILAAAIASLAACSPAAPAHDVAYYRTHADARASMMAACRNDRGKVKADSNCVNALAADSEAVSKKFWTAPAPPSRVRSPGQL
jgi:hypothetical protein